MLPLGFAAIRTGMNEVQALLMLVSLFLFALTALFAISLFIVISMLICSIFLQFLWIFVDSPRFVVGPLDLIHK